ncbi:MAG: 4-hydroxythreonine-4-phosphate dehydrogenase PdxA [Spirochaetota bacterium]|nr:4-hydroxythreonine-4-phosphate dehydrogenase PdxA [Spirochaetota bacterium]
MTQPNQNPILITSGDPHGIGPEVILKGLSQSKPFQNLIIGSYEVFLHYQKALKLNIPLNPVSQENNKPITLSGNHWNILNIPYNSELRPGQLSKEAGDNAIQSLDVAISLIKRGYADTLITGPVNKEAINLSGLQFTGHTEYLAETLNSGGVTMLMLSDKLKVALVTTHLPIESVSRSLSTQKVLATIKRCSQFLHQLNFLDSKILVCALNPHGGEGGHFGSEESDIILPAVDLAKSEGLNVSGPYSADSVFRVSQSDADNLYIAMYHDQGLIPFKLLSAGRGVNLTLGLPCFRVSVDHGTAFDIAGRGIAQPDSFLEAIRWTGLLSQARAKNKDP